MQRDFYKTDLEVLKCNRVKGNTEKEFRKKLLYITICSNENYQRKLKEFDIGVVKLTLNGLSDDLYKFSAKKYKLSKSVISTYLAELVDEGLLEVIQKGSNNNNSASFYRITTYKKNRTDIETENRTQNRTHKQSNFNSLNDNTRTDIETDIKTENWNSKKELKKIIKKNIFVETSDEYRLAKYLFELIRENNPTHKEPNLQNWAKDIDKMIRLDKREVDDIEAVIYWCQHDDFWSRNVLSTSKLRIQYDQLKAKMKPKQPVHVTEKPKEEFSAFGIDIRI